MEVGEKDMGKVKEKANHFWREIDHRDFLLIISSTCFFLFITIGLVMLLIGIPIDPLYIDLLSMMSPILITITSGIFGVKAIQTFKGGNKETSSNHSPSNNPSVEIRTEFDNGQNQQNYNQPMSTYQENGFQDNQYRDDFR